MKILQGADVHPSPKQMEEMFNLGRPLIIKAGFDPTKDDLHLGHSVLLHKLREFQDLGHRVILVFGDFTATVGDPTGKNEARPAMDITETRRNANKYSSIVFQILDEKKTQVVRNSTWFGTFNATDMIRLTSMMTVARMLEREDFSNRFFKVRAPIHLHEFIYPLLQGWDSVEIAKRFGHCDIELGGSDQLFNLMVGRELMRKEGLEPQAVMTMRLLEGTDAIMVNRMVEGPKMSKSLGNYIGLTEPANDFLQKLMLIKDDVIWHFMDLLLLDATDLKAEVASGLSMREAKLRFARMVMGRFFKPEQIEEAISLREAVAAGAAPADTQVVSVTLGTRLVEALASAGLTKSNSDGTRLIKGGAIRLNDQVVSDPKLTVTDRVLVRIGTKNRTFVWLEPKRI